MPQTIGIFGGTFDPVHIGHLRIAEAALVQLHLSSLLFVPNSRSPLKPSGASASFEDRIAMLRLATHGMTNIDVSEVEGRRGGTSYTIDTLRELVGQYQGAQFYLIVGGDALRDFHLWREFEEIRRLARLAYVTRPGTEIEAGDSGTTRVVMPPLDVSSTAIRDRVRRRETIDEMVPKAVAEYIASHQLYLD